MKKMMILGDTGLVGKHLVKEFPDYEIIGLSRSQERFDYKHITFDLENNDILDLLIEEKPDIFVSATRGAYEAQYRCHKSIFEYAKVNQMAVYFYSTANVFDGVPDGIKIEQDPVKADSAYGQFKISVEELCRKYNGHIIRLPLVFAEDSPRINQLKGKKMVKIKDKVITTCITAERIARMQRYVIEHHLEGIFHFAPTDTETMRNLYRSIAGSEMYFEIEKIDTYYLAVVNTREDLPFMFSNADVLTELS